VKKKSTGRIKYLVTLLLALAVVAGAVYLYLLPRWNELKDLQAEVEDLRSRVDSAQNYLQRWDEIVAEREQAVSLEKELDFVLPAPENEQAVLNRLDTYLQQNSYSSFSLTELKAGEGVLYREGTLILEGSIDELQNSLQRLETFAHPVNYDFLGVGKTEGGYSLQLNLRVYLEDDGRGLVEPAGGEGNEQGQQ